MSVHDFLERISQHEQWVLIGFVAVPVLAFLASLLVQTDKDSEFELEFAAAPDRAAGPVDYLLSVFTYLAAIPGMFAAVLVFYTLLIVRQSLLEVSVTLYFVPILSMALTFGAIGRKVRFETLPGFGRLSGLMLMLGLSCGVVLFLYRLHFGILFFSSITGLFVAGLVVFVLIKLAAHKMAGPKDDKS